MERHCIWYHSVLYLLLVALTATEQVTRLESEILRVQTALEQATALGERLSTEESQFSTDTAAMQARLDQDAGAAR